MKNCFSCGALLFENAKFCHQCGTKVLVDPGLCTSCQTKNPKEAKFCLNCGKPLSVQQNTKFKPNETRQEKKESSESWFLKQAFFDALKKRVSEENPGANYADYVEEIQLSGFQEILEKSIALLFDELERLKSKSAAPFELETHKNHFLEDLLDYFIFHFCAHLNRFNLPEKFLKYQGKKLREINLVQLCEDYLDFENEQENFYTDFIQMPLKKLQNASESFLKPEKGERILFICDQSFTGTCKEGFAMTEVAIYWKAHLQKAQKVNFKHLVEIKTEQEWLLINGLFFNVNPHLNFKLMKLLKKLQSLS